MWSVVGTTAASPPAVCRARAFGARQLRAQRRRSVVGPGARRTATRHGYGVPDTLAPHPRDLEPWRARCFHDRIRSTGGTGRRSHDRRCDRAGPPGLPGWPVVTLTGSLCRSLVSRCGADGRRRDTTKRSRLRTLGSMTVSRPEGGPVATEASNRDRRAAVRSSGMDSSACLVRTQVFDERGAYDIARRRVVAARLAGCHEVVQFCVQRYREPEPAHR